MANILLRRGGVPTVQGQCALEGTGLEDLVVRFFLVPGFHQMLLQFQFRVPAALAHGTQLSGCRASGARDVPVPRLPWHGMCRVMVMLVVHNPMVPSVRASR